MLHRELGNSGINVSEIGFGCWAIGGLTPGATSYGQMDPRVARKAIFKALDLGINFFDTANVYGDGNSERLLGEVLSSNRTRVVIASKVGMKTYQEKLKLVHSEIQASIEGSLRRLKCDYLDLLQLHLVGLDTLRRDPLILESLEQFKAQGKIRCIGISLNNPCDALDPLIVEHFEVIQTNFSLLDMRLLTNGFLKSENAKKVGVLARTPFNFGFLANNFPPDVRFDSRDHRSKWPKSQLLSWINGANGVLRSLKISDLNSQEERVKLALGFCLSFQRISSTLAGMTTPEEVMLNVKSLQHCKLDGDLLISAQEFYKSWEKQSRIASGQSK